MISNKIQKKKEREKERKHIFKILKSRNRLLLYPLSHNLTFSPPKQWSAKKPLFLSLSHEEER